MFAFRSLTLGLLGACFLLLATRPAVEIRRVCTAPPPAIALIVDVAPGVSASQLASLVRLDAGEHVATIDDRAVAGDIDAGVRLAALDLRARRYLDLGVQGPSGTRRILVLLH